MGLTRWVSGVLSNLGLRNGFGLRLLALLVALLAALPALAGTVIVDVLDVGQGDAIVIRGGGKTVLIDASIKSADVIGQLRKLGIERLDLVVATHPHADHIGGMEEVVRNEEVGLYLDNGLPHTTATYTSLMTAIEERGIPYKPARRGMEIRMGTEATLYVLNPADTPLTGTRSDLNSNSVVVEMVHGKNKFLFTGDSEEPTEHLLLTGGIEPMQFLKVAHHGSEHSSTPEFLARLHPLIAVISCGTGNRYGHPDPEALLRYKTIGSQVYRTDLSGQIRAISDGATIEMLEGTLDELGRGDVDDGQPSRGMRRPEAPAPAPAPAPTVYDPRPKPKPAPVAAAPSPSPSGAPSPAPDLSGVQRPNPAFESETPKERKKRLKAEKKAEKARLKAEKAAAAAAPAPAPDPAPPPN